MTNFIMNLHVLRMLIWIWDKGKTKKIQVISKVAFESNNIFIMHLIKQKSTLGT